VQWSAVAIFKFSLAGTDLVLAEKDAVGKLATAPGTLFSTPHAKYHAPRAESMRRNL
jgi:hypothetical protein